MEVKFPTVKVCQYCDREIVGTAWVSFAERFTATLCSPQCKERYEDAAARQGTLRWDVT